MLDRCRSAGQFAALVVAALLLDALAASTAAGQVPPVVPGFPNTTQSAGDLLSGLNAPGQGRTAIIAYHNGVLFTVPELPSSAPGSDFQVRTWDLSDPAQPMVTSMLGISPMPINAHGYFKSGEYLVLGANWPPEAPWSFRATTPGTVERTTFPDHDGAGVRGQLFQPWYVGPTYWSYGEVSGLARLELNGNLLSEWDHLGETGVIGHPFILGDLLIYASDQSRTGVATYDISDPTQPVLLDVLTTGGPGGYWPELWGGDGKLYAVFPYRTGGNGFRVVDLTDPSDLRFVTDRPLPGAEAMYMQFQDEYAFVGGHKVDMRTFESVLFLDGENAVRTNDGGTGIDTSQFALPLGNLLITGGVGPDQGMAIWAHQDAPDTRGPTVGFHVPRDGRANYPVGAPVSLLIHETLETFTLVNGETFIVRPLGGSAIEGRLTYAFDDVLTFTPDTPLQPDTTYEVVLPAGGIKDAAGNGIDGYAFTFSTGSAVGGNRPPVIDSFTAASYPVSPGANQQLTAAAADPNGDSIEYRFDFGDGSPSTAWSASATAGHAYAQPGHYRTTVQARDTIGALGTASLTVTVIEPPAGPRSVSSSPIACDGDSRRAWSVNPDNDTLAAVALDGVAALSEVAACDDPRGVARTASGELWLACHDDDRLLVLDAAGSPITSLSTGYGSAPVGVVASPDGAAVFVTLHGAGELRRFDAASRQQNGSVDLGPTPRAIAISGDGGQVLVTRFVSPRDHAEVWRVDAASMSLIDTLRLPKLGGDENRDTTASGRGVANYLAGIAISPDGGSAWVASHKANTERGLLFADDLDEDNTLRNILTRIDLASGEVAQTIDLDNSDSAAAIDFSPLGDYLFVALQGSNEVHVLDTLVLDDTSGLGSLVTRLGTGLASQGLCLDTPGHQLLAHDFMGRTVTVLDIDDLLRTGSKTVPSAAIVRVGAEALPADVLLGKQLFYNAADERMSGEGYLSCASCHIDGGHDGRTWDFTGRGEGLRNTTSLRGRAGMEHGNVHWSANFDEIQDFENDIRGAFGGRGFLSDADFDATSQPLGPAKAGLSAELDALAAYVASLGRETLPRSPFREADGSLTADGVAGRALFASLSCDSCHRGPERTDSTRGTGVTLHDVGTMRTSSGGRLGGSLDGIDTPTVLGIWNTAPYLHDGSAQALEDVFVVAGGDVVQAETGSVAGGAQFVSQYVDLNNDDTAHERAFVALRNTGARMTLSSVDGGSGGVGALEIRYSTNGPQPVEARVNGTPYAVGLEATGNDPGWRHTHWKTLRIENVALSAGTSNTIDIEALSNFPDISLDDVLISTADALAQAQPHRQVLDLSAGDQAALVAFLRQLDSQTEAEFEGAIFDDDFESGDTTAWSSSVP